MKSYLLKCPSLFFILFSVLPFISDAQPANIFCRHYNMQNGLISMNTEFIYIDREGYTWFANANGLQQFDGYDFTNYFYDADDTASVSYNFISSLSEDSQGNIWIGTLGRGVNILNKKKRVFYHLFNSPDHSQVLTSNIVPRGQHVFALDDEGYMWLNTANGLNRINTADLSVERYFGDFAGEILFDRDDKLLWIVSNVLKKFNPRTKQIEYYQIYSPAMRDVRGVNSIHMDDESLIWLGTQAGLVIFDKVSSRFYSLPEYFENLPSARGIDYSWSFQPVESVYSNQGFIWIAIGKDLIRLDKQMGTFQLFRHELDNPGSLKDEKISGIFGDGSRLLWIAYASNGVSKMMVSLKEFQYYRYISGDPRSLSSSTVRSVFLDHHQNLWIGNYSDGLNRIIPENPGKTIHYKCEPSDNTTLNSNNITAIFVDSRDRLWVGTFDKGFCYTDKVSRMQQLRFKRFLYEQNLEIQDFTEDASGNIWIGTQEGFYFYDYSLDRLIHYGELKYQSPEIQQINIQSVHYEPPDVFWVTTWNRGLCRLKIRSDARLSMQVEDDQVVFYEGIRDINQSNIDNCFISLYKEDSIIWLGSPVNGLVKMILRRERADFMQYGQSSGAPGNSVYGIARDKKGKIWIATNYGMGRFDPVTEKFFNYYESDGLLSNTFVWNAAFQSPDGRVFFGSINGLVSFNPEGLSEDTTHYKIRFSKLIVQNKELQAGDKINGRLVLSKSIEYTDSITLTYRERVFTIEFTAPNTIAPEDIIYSYKLEGFDNEWIRATAQKRYATYTNLSKGTYTFLVRASNNIGFQDQVPASLTIRILPPWWETPVALTVFTIFFIALLLAFRWLILARVRLIHQAKLEHIEREKTEELYQFKMRFFTDISHEFRTPLSLIMAPLQKIIEKAGNDPQLKKQGQLISKNADRLLRLIDQVMDMRKIELNKMKLVLGRGDIVGYVKELTSAFDEIALQRSMILEFSSFRDSWITWFDESKLEKILINLLSNSFKYTPDKGRIQVNIGLRTDQDEVPDINNENQSRQEFMEIKIRDNGIGIPAEFQSRLFERFLVIERHDSIVRRGTGIGLALTKELVDLHKGRILVESEENKGSCFVIMLPVIIEPGKTDDRIEIVPEGKSARESIQKIILSDDHEYVYKFSPHRKETAEDKTKPVLLFVEDETGVRDFFRENFEANYRIFEAADGKKGFEIALHVDPDLIISDLIMPVMDGVELCRKIKSDVRTSHIPFIILTARSTHESKMEGLETGADAYIEKPFELDLLEAQIINLLNNRKILRSKFSREMILQPADIVISSGDAVFIRKAMGIVEKHMADAAFGSEEFCREIGMSRSQLHRKLRALTTQSTSEFIRTIRLKQAAGFIRESQLSIEEISYRVGFNSPAYFTKCFKSLFGKTPSEWAEKGD